MNKKATARSSSLFLIELMMAILFFSVTAGICVQFFVKARLMSQDAVDLNAAVSECTSAAEAILAGDDLSDIRACLTAVYPQASFSEDNTGALTDQLSVTFSQEDSLLTATVVYQLEAEEDPVYSLTVEKYLPGGTS
jgi:hypothetical protein